MLIKSIHIKGYKSIDSISGASLELGDVTVLLGANGVGKSNLISFFSLLDHIRLGNFQNFVGQSGYADSFLYFGANNTRQIEIKIEFNHKGSIYNYEFTLTHAAGDTLIFTSETVVVKTATMNNAYPFHSKSGGKESYFWQISKTLGSNKKEKLEREAAKFVWLNIATCGVFHFHDTSTTAKMRGQGYIEDNRELSSDGRNLAAFLFHLKENPLYFAYYSKIIRYIQKVMPQFLDFELRPNASNKNYITLNWKDKYQSHLFGPHQISDGSLRFMALATLLLQPIEFSPSVIILDEPELGLHPSAIAYLAGMIKAASKKIQIVVATQSQRLVDEFELSNIVIVERDKVANSTVFQRKNPEALSNWLEEYSLSELWEKNVIGGQP